ncbi:response regulator [Streptomyces sp. NBC_01235]|uniref:response regulator n=1 Tax=Streptomyces sp. NBC_01235 TaxID=2903788 RepID=UPI002E0F2353|nr:response regulator transcription factor [Streptomyces sp. NBC_01235]
MIRAVVVDDKALVRSGFGLVLGASDDIEVVATASGGDAVDTVRRVRPDVVLLDIRMPDVDGLTVLRELRMPDSPVVAMSRARALWERVPAPVVDIVLVAVAAEDVWLTMWDHTRLGVALATLGCAALVFRRRFPLGVFLLTLPIALTQEVALAPLVALFTLAERSRSRPLLSGCVALTAVASSVPWPLSGFAEAGRTMTLIDFVYSLATAVTPVLFG